ncbi:MAG: hypothetical protein JSU83_00955 [Deltaproteobacteria bacterium]|nr:MAG: hypothetical protein JSU83_00955 [Deltaproteobacteria bacterium]
MRRMIQGSGYFFHNQMITPVLLNGKGLLPPRWAKAAASCGFAKVFLSAGSKMRGGRRLEAPVPMIRHLVVEKIAPIPELLTRCRGWQDNTGNRNLFLKTLKAESTLNLIERGREYANLKRG